MKLGKLFLIACAAVCGVSVANAQIKQKTKLSMPSGKMNEIMPGRVLVKFRPARAAEIEANRTAQLLAADGDLANATFRSRLGDTGWTVWTVDVNADIPALVATLNKRDDVILAETSKRIYPLLSTPNDGDWGVDEDNPDLYFTVEGDPYFFKRLWHLDDTDAFAGWSSWPNTWYTAANKPQNCPTIAVIDTGVDLDHPDFRNLGGSSTSHLSGGQLDLGNSLRFTFGEPDPTGDPYDFHGHGTHVAGLAVASGNNGSLNGHGTIGTGFGAKAMSLRVFDDSGVGSDADAAGAILHAVANGVDVINLSLGTEAYSQLFQDMCTYAFQKGVLVVAAGNEDGAGGGDLGPIYPAACSGVVGVTANGPNFFPATSTYSGTGYYIDLAAPGGDVPFDGNQYSIQFVWATAMMTEGVLAGMSHSGLLFPYYFTEYAHLAGTSMACPIVAGAAAHYFGKYNLRAGNYNNYRALRALQLSAFAVMSPPYGVREDYQGFGCLDMGTLMADSSTKTFTAGSIEGIVYYGATPRSNTAVRAKRGTVLYSTTTRPDGTYLFDSLPTGYYELSIPAAGVGMPITKRNVYVRNGCQMPGVDLHAEGTFTWDDTAPVIPKLTVPNSTTANKVSGSIWAYDTETDCKKLTVKIGTTSGAANSLPEQEIYLGADTTSTDLGSFKINTAKMLTRRTYYLTLTATNGAGLTTTRTASFMGGPIKKAGPH